MKRSFLVLTIAYTLILSLAVTAQEFDEDRHIIIHPESYGLYQPRFEEPIPLDKTLKITFTIEGPDLKEEITLLCATSIYGAAAKEDDGMAFSVGGTVRMIRNTEILLTFDFDTTVNPGSFGGQGSIKIKLGNQKTIYKWGEYSLTVSVDLESE